MHPGTQHGQVVGELQAKAPSRGPGQHEHLGLAVAEAVDRRARTLRDRGAPACPARCRARCSWPERRPRSAGARGCVRRPAAAGGPARSAPPPGAPRSPRSPASWRSGRPSRRWCRPGGRRRRPSQRRRPGDASVRCRRSGARPVSAPCGVRRCVLRPWLKWTLHSCDEWNGGCTHRQGRWRDREGSSEGRYRADGPRRSAGHRQPNRWPAPGGERADVHVGEPGSTGRGRGRPDGLAGVGGRRRRRRGRRGAAASGRRCRCRPEPS